MRTVGLKGVEVERKAERFKLTDGVGLLEVCGSGFDTLLLVAGQPVVLAWGDWAGSVGHYLHCARSTEPIEPDLATLRHVLNGAFDPSAPLAEQVRPLLCLFTNGWYNLICDDAASGEPYVVEYRVHPHLPIDGFYPFDETWILTQAESSLNAETVRRHRAAIDGGVRPVVVLATTEHAMMDYVIDGHHKLRAYRDAGVPPRYLAIMAKAPRDVEPAEGEAVLAKSRHLQHYRRHKRASQTR